MDEDLEKWMIYYKEFAEATCINPVRLEEDMISLPHDIYKLRVEEAYYRYYMGLLQVKLQRLTSDLFFRIKLSPHLYHLPRKPSKDTIYSAIEQEDEIIKLKEAEIELQFKINIVLAKVNGLEHKSKMVQKLQENITTGQVVIERKNKVFTE